MKKYKPATKEELKELVFKDGIKLDCVDTSLITDMSYLFHESKRKDFKGIEDWDVSNVEDMSYMFAYCSNFNQPLDKWDVSNVENMCRMFDDCKKIGQHLNSWNVSNVNYMSCMFLSAESFN